MVVADDDGLRARAHDFAEHVAHVKGRPVRGAALQKHAGKQPPGGVEGEHVKVLERAPKEQRLEVFARLAERVQARRAAERLQQRVARDGGDEAQKQRVRLVHAHVFQHEGAGFEDRRRGDEAAAKAPDPLIARARVQSFQQVSRHGVDAAHALFGAAHSSSNAPAAWSARRTSSGSVSGSPM